MKGAKAMLAVRTADPVRASALEAAYARYARELAAFIRRKFGDGPPEPEDVAHAAFARLAAVDDFAAIENARAFLYRAAKNIAIDGHRRLIVQTRHAADEAAIADAEGRADFSPERVVIGKEQLSLLQDVIKALPAKQRRFLRLNRVEGLSYAEIGRRENVSESGVRKAVERALARGLAALAEQDGEGTR